MKVLVLNSGSSSQKSALFELGQELSSGPIAPLWEGKLEWDGAAETLLVKNYLGKEFHARARVRPEHRHLSLAKMLQKLWQKPTAVIRDHSDIDVVGHRVVHGGPKLTTPALITSTVKKAIRDVSAIAPLHNAAALRGIEYVEKTFPKTPQVAMFDTGFHRTLPASAAVYPGPYEWFERQGIKRYGFHGINHEHCAHRAAQMLGREVSSLTLVSCHLGNGCSLCAINGGKSVDTTMGFTPLDGIMMGTRGGSIDPGILIYLMRSQKLSAGKLDNILNHESGLLGISGLSSDMRDVLKAAARGEQRATLAFDIFVHRLQSGIAAMAASLGGLNAIVFTAGIGENSPEVRRAACSKLNFLGIRLDESKNSFCNPDMDVASADSEVRVLVIRAQEDWAIARECLKVSLAMGSSRGSSIKSDRTCL